MEGEDFGALFYGKEIAYHGDGCHLRGAASQRLDKAKRNEGIDTVRLRASDGSKDVEDESKIERPLSAEAVKERAVEDLSDCKTDEITRQRERDDGGGRFEITSDGGERWEIHVDGKGIDDTEQS